MRALLGLLLAAVLSTLLSLPPVAPAVASTVDRPAIGYRVRVDGTAGGGWFGARKLWPRLVYRVDPGAADVRTNRFGPAHRVSVLDGSGAKRVSRRDTARAAYLLSAYGSRRDHRAQNAAVEVAVDHLLVGGRYGRHGSRTLARLRQSGNAAEIGFLADYMLRDSLQYAGPYRVHIARHGSDLGGYARISVRVTAAASGEPFATLPVVVSIPGKRPLVRETDADGRVEVSWHASRAGLLDVGIRVKEVPESRLTVRTPNRRGSRVAIAGVKRQLRRHVLVPVRALPTVSVSQPDVARVGSPTTGSFVVSHGVDSPRSASVRLFGPFGSATEAACTGTAYDTSTVTVSADGDYALPGADLVDPGYYVWGVDVAGNRVNAPAVTCGSPFVGRMVPKLTVKVARARVTLGQVVRAWWTAGQLPPDFTADLSLRLYGPFADAAHVSCSGTSARRSTVPLTGRASGWTPSYTPTRAGLYAWRTTLPGTEFSTPAATVCGGAFTMVRLVRP